MTYRDPAFILENVLRTATLSSPNALAAGFGLENAANGRLAVPLRFDTSETDHELRADLGAAAAAPLTRAVIGEGHDLAGALVELRSSPSGFGSGSVRASASPADASIIDLDAGAGSTDRYWWLAFVGTGAWTIPEATLGPRVVPERGFMTNWDDVPSPQIDQRRFPGALYTVRLGPEIQEFTFQADAVAGTDLAIYDELLAASHSGEPLAFWTPDSVDAVRFAQVTVQRLRRRQRSKVPRVAGPEYTFGGTLRQVREN